MTERNIFNSAGLRSDFHRITTDAARDYVDWALRAGRSNAIFFNAILFRVYGSFYGS